MAVKRPPQAQSPAGIGKLPCGIYFLQKINLLILGGSWVVIINYLLYQATTTNLRLSEVNKENVLVISLLHRDKCYISALTCGLSRGEMCARLVITML